MHITCRNCGWGLFGKAVMRVDAASVDITCPRCGEVYRVSAVKLHDGKPIDKSDMRYTYDNEHNRVPLVSRQTKNEG